MSQMEEDVGAEQVQSAFFARSSAGKSSYREQNESSIGEDKAVCRAEGQDKKKNSRIKKVFPYGKSNK